MTYKVVKMGTDPELPVMARNGKFISAKGLVKGTKHQPFPVSKGAVQLDGVAAEFNIDPASSLEEFLDNHKTVMDQISAMVAPNNVVITPKAIFDPEYFNNLSMEEKLLGCTPDIDAYTEEPNVPPSTDEPFRTFGGHIHFGLCEDFDHDKRNIIDYMFEFIKQLDSTLYIGSLLWDNDNDRRKLYGKIGSFRFKEYGVEYRPLSNMILSDPKILEWIWNTGQHVKQLTDEGMLIYNDPVVKDYITAIRQGEILDENSVIECMTYQSKIFDLPALR